MAYVNTAKLIKPAVLLSVTPENCELMLSGAKTMEIRKNRPKIPYPFKCYIYCTKSKRVDTAHLYIMDEVGRSKHGIIDHWRYTLSKIEFSQDSDNKYYTYLAEGKVIGEFMCKDVTELAPFNRSPDNTEERACMTREEIVEYLNGQGYAWHMSDLIIYDKPKDISEFWTEDKCPYASADGCTYGAHCFRAGEVHRCGSQLTRAPQSWRYVRI